MKSNKRYILRSVSLGVLALFLSSLLTRCASIMSPQGGPYDTLAPVIVNMTPDNYTTNFTGQKIYIEFNEFVQLVDQSKEFFTSPQMKSKPKLTMRGRGVVVTLPDSLEENTTYALNFGSTIRDNNESNPLYSMRYVFSTGDEIDSMIMSGYTEDSFSADSVSSTMILFFPADSVDSTYLNAEFDSVLFNMTPAVIARAETNGIFLAQNLKPIDYRVYAYEDKNNNFSYEPETDQVGFIDSVFNPLSMPDFSLWFDSIRNYVVADPQLHFKMFEDKAFKRQTLQDGVRPQQHKALLYFGASHPQIDSIRFDSIAPEDFIVEPLTKGRDTLAVWFNLEGKMLPDTIRGSVSYIKHDSLRQLVPATDPLRLTWKFFESKAEAKEREKLEKDRAKALANGEEWIEPEVKNPFQYRITMAGGINPLKPLSITFDYPLIHLDTAAISLTHISVDSVETKLPFKMIRDSSNMRSWSIKADFKEQEGNYQLVIPDSTFVNIAREWNDSIGMKYQLFDTEEFAVINIDFHKDSKDKADYIVQLLNSGKKCIDSMVMSTSGKISFKYVPAGDMSIRLIQDLDKNGERSGGNLVKRLTPERVAYFIQDGESIFTTKKNWDFDFKIDASEMFRDESMEMLIERLEQAEEKRREAQLIEDAKKRAEQAAQQSNSSGGGMMPSMGSMSSITGGF